jgi:hypothetical protein
MSTWSRVAASVSAVFIAGGDLASAATIPSFCDNYPQSGGSQSSRVFYSGGRLSYASDSAQNRIPDYSHAGYKAGEEPIPSVPEVQRLSATSGDQTARIQAALDAVGARTPDANGIRGALVLNAGTYQINGTLRVNKSGVVLRGVGDSTSGTVLRAVGDTPHQRPVIILGSGSGWSEVSPRTDITTSFVQVGSRSFQVASTSGFAVGNEVVVRHPSSSAWINAVGGGGTNGEANWSPGSIEIVYHRRIASISGTTVTIDAPVYNHLNRSLTQSYMTRISWSYITRAAVESLRIDIVTAGGTDENHAWNGILVQGAQDSWIRNITALHFGFAAVSVTRSSHTTVEDSDGLDPVGVRTGGRFYNFQVGHHGQLVLFKNCRATNGRHGFISSGGPDASGIVFYRSTSSLQGDNEAGHMKWTQGVLFDNFGGGTSVKLINRGNMGTSHGWGAAHSTAWQIGATMFIQKPPTAQNYGISTTGSFSTSYPQPGPAGHTEMKSAPLVPSSLYEAQLCDRLESGTPPQPTPTPTPTPTPDSPQPTATPTPTATPGGAFIEITPAGPAVTASTHDGNLPANTVDNNLTTRWSANGDGQWIKYDLGTVRTISHVAIAVYNGNARQNRFDLQVSSDNVSWTNVITDGLTSGTTTAEEVHDFADTSARWVRYLGHGATTSTFNSVAEVSVFAPNGATVTPTPTATPSTPEPTPTPTATPDSGPVEITPGAAGVTASTHDGNLPTNVVDNSLATRWSANGDGQWIQLDLGTTRTVSHVRIATYNGDTRQTRFDLQVATTPGAWTNVLTNTLTSGTTTGEETFDFADVPARYVRYLGHGNTVNLWNSVTEVSVFGQ